MLARPESRLSQLNLLEADWARFEETSPAIAAMKQVGKYLVVHPNFSDGTFAAPERDEAAGPDWFEVGIGNLLAYSASLCGTMATTTGTEVSV